LAESRKDPELSNTKVPAGAGNGERRTAVLIVRSDKFANSVKPRVLEEHLRGLDFDVRSIESASLGRRGASRVSMWLPRLSLPALRLYARHLFQAATRATLWCWNSPGTRYLNGISLLWTMRGRGEYLARKLGPESCDVLICESPFDQAVVLQRVATKQLLDLPCPYAEELLFSNQVSAGSHRRLRALEERCLSASDRASFHWHTYEAYVSEHYRASVRWLDCSYGVTPKEIVAKFSPTPRIVFLGSLEGQWINLPMLERLSRRYQIDVWGGPPPRKGSSLNYLGYAPDLDILADYQVGLVTISDDPLRRMGFSSKQLQYFSYGLPVLVPEWRSDPVLAPATVSYTEDTFLAQVATLGDRAVWETTSARALELASELSWDAALGPLTKYLGS
jgi:hypothetical protein